MALKIVLFDIDGTLLSSAGAGKAALEKSLAENFGVEKIVDGLALSGRTDLAIVEDLFRLHHIPSTPGNHTTMRRGYLAHLPECLGQVAGMVLPGIHPLLMALEKRADCALGLLTGNFREGAKIKLGHYGIEGFFDLGGYGDRHLDRDEVAREALGEVQTRFQDNVRPEHIWVVGDTPLDIRCARAIGAKVVAVATGWHGREELRAHGPDLLVSDFSDSSPFFSAVFGNP